MRTRAPLTDAHAKGGIAVVRVTTSLTLANREDGSFLTGPRRLDAAITPRNRDSTLLEDVVVVDRKIRTRTSSRDISNAGRGESGNWCISALRTICNIYNAPRLCATLEADRTREPISRARQLYTLLANNSGVLAKSRGVCSFVGHLRKQGVSPANEIERTKRDRARLIASLSRGRVTWQFTYVVI